MASQYNNPGDSAKRLAAAVAQLPSKVGRPGRPRVITEEIKPLIFELHKKGYGYHAISKVLCQHGISIHWSTIQRFIKERERSHHRPIDICISTHLAKNYHSVGH